MFNCRTLIFSFTPIEIVFQRDLRWWTRRQVWSFIQNFSSFQSHNFWNAISWKCSLKDDCIRSCLTECQSLCSRKVNINPKYHVLMPLPCTVHIMRLMWYREVNMFRMFMIFVSWISGQEEYCLSSAQILTSRYQSIVDDRMKIECASDVVDVMEYSTHCSIVFPLYCLIVSKKTDYFLREIV